jgi:chemotaxis methyl-accepting protein methylase/PAS domain-containing protein
MSPSAGKRADPIKEPGPGKKGITRVTAPKKTRATDKKKAAHGAGQFPIIGIGASAGGLEALEKFLGGVRKDSGMAFVIVQHLDPTHKGILVELLQRTTDMEVTQVEDNMEVFPDHVYVIPPNKDLSLLHGSLFLLDPVAPRGLRLPIDFFFRSLAEDLQERSIGVILSGMGTDGTAGLMAIKEKAGVALVQDPSSAGFDGMPRSAIDAGVADIVAPADQLAEKIIAYLNHAPDIPLAGPIIEERSLSSLAKIFVLLRERTGNDFSFYKKSSVYRRVERRMAIHQIDKISTYVHFLQANPGELDLLFHELLIGVTSFFRDPEAWVYIRDTIFPTLFSEKPGGTTFRAWVAGCSTGEEAYSLAIIFREALDREKPGGNYSLQIFATDLDRDAIDKARQGTFPPNIAADVSPERLSRYFSEESNGYRVRKEIREMVIFASQNLIMDPPFTKLDILCCRNLLIYLEQELQKKLIPLFFYSVKPGGVLFLGSAETIGGFSNLFTPIENKLRLYRRLETFLTAQVEFPGISSPRVRAAVGVPAESPAALNIQSLADQLILRQFSPSAVLTTDKGDILYVNGRTGKYLEPAAGKANWNIFVMAREGLRYELAGAFQKAVREHGTETVRDVPVRTNGGMQNTDCTVQVIKEPKELAGLILIVFSDTIPPAEIKEEEPAKSTSGSKNKRLTELEHELRRRYEEIRTVREENQTSQEELKSANEELQSTNEELQSTNEELTTSREEMQSMNEELQTVNAELQDRVEQFSETNDDMKNLLNSTEIATIFLDESLNIRQFTPPVTRIIHFIKGDAGRPITDIASDLLYPDLYDDAKNVLDTLVFSEKEIPTRDGRWYIVRIIPYRTGDNVIKGLVINFTDISVLKQKELDLDAIRHFSDAIIATVREPLLVLDKEMKVVVANRSFYQKFHVPKEETIGESLYTLGSGQWDIPELRTLLEKILPEKIAFDNYKVRHTFPEIGERVMELNARQVLTKGTPREFILLAIEDVTDRNGEDRT